MAVSREAVEIEISARIDGLKKGLADVNSSMDKMGEKAGAAAEKSGTSFLNLAAKVTAAYAAVSGMVNAYLDDAKANAKLTLAIKNNTDETTRNGKSVSDLNEEYKDFANQQQKLTGIGDEVTLSLQGMLVSLGTAPKEVTRVTAALQDMEAVTGMSAESMARMWSRLQAAPEEALGALSRVGITLRKEQLAGMSADQQRVYVLEQLEKRFKGQAQAMAEVTGGLAQAKAAFGDFLEVLGKIVIAVISPFLKGMTEILSFFNGMSTPLQVVTIGVIGLAAGFIALRTAGITSFAALGLSAKAFFASIGPVGWAVGIIGTLVSVLGLFSGGEGVAVKAAKSVQDFSSSVGDVNNKLDEFQKSQNSAGKEIGKLLNTLQYAKEGTDEYRDAIFQIKELNPALANSNINVASSYGEVLSAVNALNTATGKASLLNAGNKLADDAKNLATSFQDIVRSGLNSTEQAIQTGAIKQQIQEAYVKLKKVDEALGTSLVTKFWTSINDGLDNDRGIKNIFRSWKQSLEAGQDLFTYQPRVDTPARANNLTTNRGYNQFGGSGAGNTAAEKKSIYDIEAARIAAMRDTYQKQRMEIEKSYLDEYKKIKESANYEKDGIEALALLEQKTNDALMKVETEQRVESMNAVASAMSSAMDIGTQIIAKDWKGALGEFISLIPGVGGALSGVFSSAITLFSHHSDTALEAMQKKLNKIIRAMESANDQAGVDLASNIFGSDSAAYAEKALREAQDAVDAFMAANPLAAGMSDEAMLALREQLNNDNGFMKSLGGESRDFYEGREYSTDKATKAYDKIVAEVRAKYGSNADVVLASLGIRTDKGSAGFNRWIKNQYGKNSFWKTYIGLAKDGSGMAAALAESAGKAAEALKLLDDATVRDALAIYKEQLEDIDHQIKTGKLSDDEAIQAQLDIYDQMIAQINLLDESAEKEAALNKLMEERYSLLKQQGDQLEINAGYMDDANLKALLAQQQEIERKITTGELRAGTYDTVSQQQSVLQAIIGNLRGQGADKETIFGFEKQLADLMGTTLGTGGFAALSGSGSAVTLPSYASAIMPWQTGGASTNMSRNTANSITLQTNLPPDFSSYIIREIQRQSGRNILQGAY